MGVVLPEPGILKGLSRVTRKHKALLIFDEVITGFRLCHGGAQTLYGIKPDLTCLGKIVGGGFPLAAYGGRREIMEYVAPIGSVYQAGTLSGNPVAVAAGLECLRLLKRENPYPRLQGLTEELARELREAARASGVPVRINSLGSLFTVFFTRGPVRDYVSARRADAKLYARFFHGMLERGVYFPPAQFEAAFLSSAHTLKDVERTAEAARSVFAALT